MSDLDTKAALPDDIAVALDHGAITERDAADEMAKRLRAAVAEVERLRADVRQFERAASEILDDARWFDEHYDDGDEASDRAHRIIQRVLGLFVGRELPGPWAFDKLLDERNELRGDVERLQWQAAAMREALKRACELLLMCFSPHGINLLVETSALEVALSPDAGKGWVSPEKAREVEAAAKEKVHALDALVCSVSEERDKALADRKVLVDAARGIAQKSRYIIVAIGHRSPCAIAEDALRAVGEEP